MIRLLLNTDTGRGQSFTAFALIGVASLFCVQALYFMPVLWAVMLVSLQVMSVRTFFASLLGVLMPYWLLLPFLISGQCLSEAGNHFGALTEFRAVADFSVVPLAALIIIAVVLLLAAAGITYTYRHNTYDRLRLRQAFNGYAILFVVALLLLLLQPSLYVLCLVMMALSASPFVVRMLTRVL